MVDFPVVQGGHVSSNGGAVHVGTRRPPTASRDEPVSGSGGDNGGGELMGWCLGGVIRHYELLCIML